MGTVLSPKISPFAYNHSLAMYFFPMSKERVMQEGLWWSDYEIHVDAMRTIPAARLPDAIGDVPDDVLDWAILCGVSGKPFKMIKQELAFLRRIPHPAPREHPDVRMARRRTMMNPYRLWQRPCAKCGKGMQTSYSPDRPEIVYCESCYLQSVY